MTTPKEECDQTGMTVMDGAAVVVTEQAYERSIGYRDGKPVSVIARFDQRKWWRRQDDSWVRIADMSPGHRYNTAAMLMRNAAHHAHVYSWALSGKVAAHDGGDMAHDALERMADEVTRQSISDPRGWLRGCAIYQALTAGLTVRGEGAAPWQQDGGPNMCEVAGCRCSGEAHP